MIGRANVQCRGFQSGTRNGEVLFLKHAWLDFVPAEIELATHHFNCRTKVADTKKIVLRQATSDFNKWSPHVKLAITVVQLLSC